MKQTLIEQAAAKGWRTSEFWVTLVAIVGPLVPGFVAGWEHYQATGSVAAAVAAGAYAIARAWGKAKTIDAAPSYDYVPLPSSEPHDH